MRRVFKTRHFNRWMRKSELTDAALCMAVNEMTAGLIDAELGGDVVKKRRPCLDEANGEAPAPW